MNIVKIGSMVIFKQEKTRVNAIKDIKGEMFAVLELTSKRCFSVPCLEIKRNGTVLFVTPNGCNIVVRRKK